MTSEPAIGISTRDPGGRKGATYDQIKESILDGSLPPGTILVEAQLAADLGVSRTPVREALTRLQQDGIVERGERGLVVRSRSPEQILDIYEARIVLEGTVARVAAERHNSYDRARLEGLTRSLEDVNQGEATEMVKSNRDFHSAVWYASHSDALIDLLSRLNLHLGRYPATTLTAPGRWDRALKEHNRIVRAIIARDAEAAETLAREHFTHAREIRLALWEENQY